MTIAKDRNQDRVDLQEAALTMAIAVLVERIRSLPKEDKDDLFHLSKALFDARDDEELKAAQNAFQEILDQKSTTTILMPMTEEPTHISKWLSFVGNRIKTARDEAGLTQESLAELTGLPQSHISRLENGLHSPSSATLEKIAKATGKPESFFDPSC
jgi:DNA-binding XRE family transcriptional regulator